MRPIKLVSIYIGMQGTLFKCLDRLLYFVHNDEVEILRFAQDDYVWIPYQVRDDKKNELMKLNMN